MCTTLVLFVCSTLKFFYKLFGSFHIYSSRIEGTLIPTTGPFLYLLARQCRIKWLSFSAMACMHVPNWKNVLGVSAVIRCVW